MQQVQTCCMDYSNERPLLQSGASSPAYIMLMSSGLSQSQGLQDPEREPRWRSCSPPLTLCVPAAESGAAARECAIFLLLYRGRSSQRSRSSAASAGVRRAAGEREHEFPMLHGGDGSWRLSAEEFLHFVSVLCAREGERISAA